YHWIWGALGGAVENGRTILEQLNGHLDFWRRETQTAGTQADVVTHSFGGFVAREAAQTQADPNPITFDEVHNFRSASNWGHGLYHELITLAATHRGSAAGNAVAFLNQNGATPGQIKQTACSEGLFIDKGALRDQMVLSQALHDLNATPVPGHAVVGS